MSQAEFDDPRASDALRDAAEAREHSYVPYSRFRMGAAVVTDRNAVVPGTLVETVSLGLAMCAERVALLARRGAPPSRSRALPERALPPRRGAQRPRRMRL